MVPQTWYLDKAKTVTGLLVINEHYVKALYWFANFRPGDAATPGDLCLVFMKLIKSIYAKN